MKAWTKRVIWFFGNWLLIILNEFAYAAHEVSSKGAVPYLDISFIGASELIILGIILIPLFFFKDDKK